MLLLTSFAVAGVILMVPLCKANDDRFESFIKTDNCKVNFFLLYTFMLVYAFNIGEQHMYI